MLTTNQKRFAGFFAVCVLFTAFQNCGPGFEVMKFGSTNVSSSSNAYSLAPNYFEIKAKILDSKCMGCHSSGAFNMSSYATAMSDTNAINPANPATSKMFLKVAGGMMPPGAPLAQDDVQAIYSQ